jgi:hypothetical protein
MNWKWLILLVCILSVLIWWDRQLTTQQSEQRAASARIGSLFGEEPLQGRTIAAVRVDIGLEHNYLYVYQDGLWRCINANGAPADNDLIESIFPMLLEAQGVVRTTDPAEAAAYGLASDDAVRVSLCGAEVFTDPLGDVILGVDVGRSISATGGSFVRPVGSNAIWEINQDVRAVLDLEDPAMPPMLDPYVIPRIWPGARLGPAQVVVQVRNQPTIIITRREHPEDEPRAPDAPAWQWVVSEDDSHYLGDLFQVTSYLVFLTRMEYAGVINPRPLEQLGLDQPRAIIGYVTPEGHQLELHIGGDGQRGGVIVYNSFTGNIYEVPRDIALRMVPQIDVLLSTDHGNPWEQWMRR